MSEKNNSIIPKTFVSYSHDSLEHKKWILDLATRMRNNGVDAIIDQWELQPGSDLPHFMETHLSTSDKIVMVCTERYVRKANSGEGGVGYEKMIITSNLLVNIDQNKIIPLIRQSGSQDLPTFLKSKLYIDFSNHKDYEFGFDELIRTIHNSPLLVKPKIGNNPFKVLNTSSSAHTDVTMNKFMKLLAKLFNSTTNDYIIYSQIVKNINISRIFLDLIIRDAVAKGYISQDNEKDIWLLEKGKFYAINNELIE